MQIKIANFLSPVSETDLSITLSYILDLPKIYAKIIGTTISYNPKLISYYALKIARISNKTRLIVCNKKTTLWRVINLT